MKSSNTNFKKSLVAIVIAAGLFTATSQAHENNSCNVELDAGFSIDKKNIKFLEKEAQENSDGETFNRVLYTITNDNQLIIDNEIINLDSDQKELVSEYASNIRELIPEVREVALEGVDLAVEGVNLAFNGLLGEDNDVASDLTSDLEELRGEVGRKFTAEHGFTIGVEGNNTDDLIGEEMEERIEAAVEKAVKNAMGTILMAVGKEMMFSDNSDAFADRMESFGDNMEKEMKGRADKIEAKAQSLCYSIIEIDKIETQLQNNIEALEDINVLTVELEESDEDDKLTAL
jgi:hypothetical protein